MSVARFPVEVAMPARVAEERIGGVATYNYPPRKVDVSDPQGWLESWLSGKSVLRGWGAVKTGIVRSFKGGKVRHLIGRVHPVDLERGERPRVELLCSAELSYCVFNWSSYGKKKRFGALRQPVILLTGSQSSYFRLCKHCEAQAKKRLLEMIK